MTAIIQPKFQSIAIQCDLLPAVPLKLLSQKSVSSKEEEESLPSEVEEYDLDTSYDISQDENTTE